jgi:hypothetical protein
LGPVTYPSSEMDMSLTTSAMVASSWVKVNSAPIGAL